MSRSALLRTTAVVGLVGAVALAGPSSAAPAACNLVKDVAGDGGVVNPSDDVDILSADVVSDAKKVTAVLRLAGDPSGLNPEALGGKNFYVSFIAPGSANPQFLSASFDPLLGASYGTGEEVDNNGVGQKTNDVEPAVGKVEGNDITITAPLGAFSGRANLKPGQKLTGLLAEVFGQVGTSVTGGLLLLADDATGSTYTAGSPSCAKQL